MTNEMVNLHGTKARTPDLDWSQVRETVLMMELSAGQIEAAMRDSNSSVEVLTDVFTTMAGYMRMIGDTVAALPDESEAKTNLQGATEHVSGMVHQAIIAFQFYDKLVALQEKIRSKYTMREEVQMFEAVLGGMPVQEALDNFMSQMKEDHADDVELF